MKKKTAKKRPVKPQTKKRASRAKTPAPPTMLTVKLFDVAFCQDLINLCNDPAMWKTMNFAQVISAIEQAPTTEIPHPEAGGKKPAGKPKGAKG